VATVKVKDEGWVHHCARKRRDDGEVEADKFIEKHLGDETFVQFYERPQKVEPTTSNSEPGFSEVDQLFANRNGINHFLRERRRRTRLFEPDMELFEL
jgi:hypothetical protein